MLYDENINKSRSQSLEEYQQDAIANETTYKDSLMYASMPVFFTLIGFDDEEINKSRLISLEEYLRDAIANKTAYKDLLMF